MAIKKKFIWFLYFGLFLFVFALGRQANSAIRLRTTANIEGF